MELEDNSPVCFCGREFQWVEAATQKTSVPPGVALSPRDGKEVGTRGTEGGRRGVGVELIFKVGGGLVVKSL